MLDILLNTIFVNSVIWILKAVFYVIIILPIQVIVSLTKFIVSLFSDKEPDDKNKFNLSGSVFTGPVQIGDKNVMLIDEFTSFVETHQINHPEGYAIKSLLITAQKLVADSEAISEINKFKATNDLYEITIELAKPQNVQDKDRIRKLWADFISFVKDVGAILSVAISLSKILGLPLPI